MNRFQDVWSKLANDIEGWSDNEFENVWGEFTEGGNESSDPQSSKASPTPELQDDTTVRTASAISEALFDHKLTPSEKKFAARQFTTVSVRV